MYFPSCPFVILMLAVCQPLFPVESHRIEIATISDGSPHTGKLDFGDNVSIEYSYESTEKGNGILKIGGLALRVYDDHDDGAVFVDRVLSVETIDFHEGNERMLVLCGIVMTVGEKGDTPKRYYPVACIYKYDRTDRGLHPVYEKGKEFVEFLK